MAQFDERGGDARVFLLERIERPAAALAAFARPPSSSSRASAPSVSAPNVLLFDLSECAARRNVSASPAGERGAQLLQHRRRFLEERVDELRHEVGARSFP